MPPRLRVEELRDERPRPLLVLRLEERLLHRVPEREERDPLRGPVRADLRAGDAPRLLGVDAEEDRVELPAEAVDDPVLEVVVGRAVEDVPDLHPEVVEEALEEDELREALHDVRADERVVEEPPVEEDPGQAVRLDLVVAEEHEDFVLQVLLAGVEAVRARVVVELAPLRHAGPAAGEPADLVAGLDDGDAPPVLREAAARGQARRALRRESRTCLPRVTVCTSFGWGESASSLVMHATSGAEIPEESAKPRPALSTSRSGETGSTPSRRAARRGRLSREPGRGKLRTRVCLRGSSS